MHTFTDATGREWRLTLTLGAARRVRDELKVDLLQPEGGELPLLQRIGLDTWFQAELSRVLLMDQIERAGLTPEAVLEAFDAETVARNRRALYDEIILFFRQAGRPHMGQAVRKQEEMVTRLLHRAETEMAAFDVEAAIRGVSSGSSPDAPASSPGT